MSAPPPPPGQTMWHYQIGAQQFGPVPFQTLVPMIQNGTMTTATMVWREGMGQWAPAGATPELAGFFNVARSSASSSQGALGLNTNGLIIFIVLLLMCLPLCWLPWVIPSLREGG